MKLLFTTLFLAVATLAHAQNFSGTYAVSAEGSAYKLTLEQDSAGNITGTLLEDDAPFILKGKLQNGVISGTCSADGEDMSFKIEPDNGALVITVFEVFEGEVEEYMSLTFKTGGASTSGSSPEPAPTPKPAPTLDEPNVPSNAAGAQRLLWGSTLTPARGWAVKYAGGEAQLVPPSQTQNEGYILPVVAVPGGVKADNPQFSPMVKEYVAQATMGMNIVEEKPVQTRSGPGLLLAYEGAGRRMHVYVTEQNGLGVGIIASGSSEQILKRAEDLEKMFASFGSGAAQQDAALAGVWRRSSSRNSGVDQRDGSYNRSTSNIAVQLSPDGRYVYEGRSRSVISGDGFHGDSGESVSTATGRWFAGNGVLVLVSDQGDPEFLTYQMEGGTLKIVDRNGSAELYQKG